jgi:cell division protein FtsQ
MATTTARPPRSTIDPRIRARRVEVQRRVGRRRLQRVVEVGLVLAVAAGFAAALRSPLLDVDDIRVAGGVHTSDEVILENLGLTIGSQLMDVDLRSAGEAVAVLPWVREVSLHRRLDGVVEVSISERTAVAAVGEAAEAYLVDRTGQILAPAASDAALAGSLVRLMGTPPGLGVGQTIGAGASDALILAERLGTLAPGLVATVTGGDEVTATLVQGGTVRFGRADRLEAKVRSLRTVLERVDLRCLGELDVRLPGSPVLTRVEGCS